MKCLAKLLNYFLFFSSDRDLEGAVAEVIDHHQLERTASFSCSVTMDTVASCTTLVTERILSRAPEILDRQLALLLYGEGLNLPPAGCRCECLLCECLLCVLPAGVIVVDSVNLSPLVGKGTVKDSQMLQLLRLQFPDLPHRDALHTSLRTAKFDLSGKHTGESMKVHSHLEHVALTQSH